MWKRRAEHGHQRSHWSKPFGGNLVALQCLWKDIQVKINIEAAQMYKLWIDLSIVSSSIHSGRGINLGDIIVHIECLTYDQKMNMPNCFNNFHTGPEFPWECIKVLLIDSLIATNCQFFSNILSKYLPQFGWLILYCFDGTETVFNQRDNNETNVQIFHVHGVFEKNTLLGIPYYNLRTGSKNLAKHHPKWWGRHLVHAFPFLAEYQANFWKSCF